MHIVIIAKYPCICQKVDKNHQKNVEKNVKKIIYHETTSHKSFCNDFIMNLYYFITRNSMVTSILSPDNTFDTFLAICCIPLKNCTLNIP